MITSTGSLGKNVMAAEWTMQISYAPVLIAVFVHEKTATIKNIRQTREFSVNVASDEQTLLVNIAGGYSRTEIDKLKIKNSFKFLKSKYIRAPLIADSLVNAECKLLTMKKIGDHIMIVGKVLSMRHNESKKPLIYHQGRYYRIGSIIEPFRHEVRIDGRAFNWFHSQGSNRFVLKCVGAIIKSGKQILVLNHHAKDTNYETIPYVVPKRGENYANVLHEYLQEFGLKITLKQKPALKRLILRHKMKVQRANFVLFEGDLKSNIDKYKWKNATSNPLLKVLVN